MPLITEECSQKHAFASHQKQTLALFLAPCFLLYLRIGRDGSIPTEDERDHVTGILLLFGENRLHSRRFSNKGRAG